MSLPSLFTAFSVFLHSPQFRDLARHADAGNAFVRRRKLPLPALLAVMLSGMRNSVQTELDGFFAHSREQAQLVHHVAEQAFAKARAKLAATAIPALNDWLVARADADGFVSRWRGRRLVAADASTLCFGRRASHVTRAASAEMMLAAFFHSVPEGERQMLFQLLDRPTRRINRAAAHSIVKPLLPALLLGTDIDMRLVEALQLIAGRTYSHRPGIIKSEPRVARPKPHKSMSLKPC